MNKYSSQLHITAVFSSQSPFGRKYASFQRFTHTIDNQPVTSFRQSTPPIPPRQRASFTSPKSLFHTPKKPLPHPQKPSFTPSKSPSHPLKKPLPRLQPPSRVLKKPFPHSHPLTFSPSLPFSLSPPLTLSRFPLSIFFTSGMNNYAFQSG